MKWYFCLSQASINRDRHDWRNMIRVSVHTARMNTNLSVHMLYDGEPSDFTEELESQGVEVIQHRSKLYSALQRHQPGNADYLSIASGAFLRFDIPMIEKTDDYVLYTDCDVLFRSNLNFYHAAYPNFFSATCQSEMNASTDMNSGVMLLNVAAMRQAYDDLIDFTEKNLDLGLDQEILRVFFAGRYTPMDMSLNWKPYWGINPAAQIVHFHGPKPSGVEALSAKMLEGTAPVWQSLYNRSPAGYDEYNRLWTTALDSYNRGVVAADTGKTIQNLSNELNIALIDRDRWKSIAEAAMAKIDSIQTLNENPKISFIPSY